MHLGWQWFHDGSLRAQESQLPVHMAYHFSCSPYASRIIIIIFRCAIKWSYFVVVPWRLPNASFATVLRGAPHGVYPLALFLLPPCCLFQTWFGQIKESIDISLRNSPGTPSSFWPSHWLALTWWQYSFSRQCCFYLFLPENICLPDRHFTYATPQKDI